MTHPRDCTVSPDLAALLAEHGLEAMRININAAMHAQRQQHLQAAPHKRTGER